jgi:6,7-dimethyl-8-ribityllumazine synthase
MATAQKNLSAYDPGEIPSARHMKFGIVVSEWNPEITYAMCDAAIDTLVKHKALLENITVIKVPGSFELPLGAKWLAELDEIDAVLCIGCVIQGETRHFDFICQGVSQGIVQLNLTFGIPVVFGVLTTQTIEQARDRAGGKHGNKGDEAAVTAIKMVALMKDLK